MPLRPSLKLNRAFLYANLGPQILALLAQDETYARVFASGLPDIKKHTDFTPAERTQILDAFVAHICPEDKKDSAPLFQWVFNQYLTYLHNGKPIQAEDLYRVKENLSYFDSLKQSQTFKDAGHSPDVLQYKTYAAFEQMLQPFIKQKQLKEEAARQFHMTTEQRKKIMAETTVLYKGDEGMVVIPHTPESSQHWGSNTKWCISGKVSAAKYFHDYNEKLPVIMIIPTNMHDQKVAVVDKKIYDSADNTINALPPEHYRLLKKSIGKISAEARGSIEVWLSRALSNNILTEDIKSDHKYVQLKAEVYEELTRLDEGKKKNETLWENPEFVLEAFSRNCLTLKNAGPTLAGNIDFIKELCNQNSDAFKDAPREWKSNRHVALQFIEASARSMFWCDSNFRKYFDFNLDAVKVNYQSIYVATQFFNDKSFYLKCFNDCDALSFLPLSFLSLKGVETTEEQALSARIKSLENWARKGDRTNFFSHARHFKETWGDAETLFAGDMQLTLQKIKSAHDSASKPHAQPAIAAPA